MSFSAIFAVAPASAVLFAVIACLLGLCFGSFINCFAWRIVHGESVWHGRSHCATCNHRLGALDLVPVFSWLFLRGKCRYCGEKISVRYLAAELVLGAIFVALFLVYGITIQTAVLMILTSILLAVSLVDLESFTIPNGFIIAGIVLWAATVWTTTVPPEGFVVGTLFAGWLGDGWLAVAADGLAGAFVIAGAVLVFSLLFDAATGKRSMGGGDIKLLFMTGLFLGLPASLFSLIVACLLGIVFGFVFAKRAPVELGEGESDEAVPQKAFPFGPAIAAATMITLLVGSTFLSWYVGLF